MTRQKLRKTRGKEECQITGMALRLRVGLQLCGRIICQILYKVILEQFLFENENERRFED